MALDTIKHYFDGSIENNDPNIQAALMDNLGISNQTDLYIISSQEYLDSEFVNKVLIPKLSVLEDQQKISQLKAAVETNADLKDLVEKFTFPLLQKDIAPVAKTSGEIARNSLGSALTQTKNFLSDLAGITNQEERMQSMNSEITRRANRIADKFDQYVLRGDGMQYGDDRDWVGFRSEGDVYSVQKEDAQGAPEDMSRNQMVDALNSMVTQARNESKKIQLGDKEIVYADKEQKMMDILARLEFIEKGVDDALPGLNQKGTESVLSATSGGVFSLIGGVINSAWTIPTISLLALAGVGIAKSNKLAETSIIRKIPVVKSVLRDPTPAPTGGAAGTPPATPEAPQKPRGYMPIPAGSELHNMKPQSQMHELFGHTVRDSIKTDPARLEAYKKLEARFNLGKLSREEYFRRINLIIENKHTLLEKIGKLWPGAGTSTVMKSAVFVKNTAAKAGERMLGGLYTTSTTKQESTDANAKMNTETQHYRSHKATNGKTIILEDLATPASTTTSAQPSKLATYRDMDYALAEYDKALKYKELTTLIDAAITSRTALTGKKNAPEQLKLSEDIMALEAERVKVASCLKSSETIDQAIRRIEADINKAMGDVDTATGGKSTFSTSKRFNPATYDVKTGSQSILDDILKALIRK